jgi:UDP-N-acetylmuramoyl-tripeptide--D-alanyl-D-alanine ligase
MRERSRARVLTVSAGAAAEADVRAIGAPVATPEGLALTLEARGVRRTARLAFAGTHNATNALVAAGVGLALGLPLAEIVRGLEAARPAKGRCVWRLAGPLRLLDDTYNANPTNVRAALEVLAAAPGRRVVVLADMLELGDIAEEAHRIAGRAVAAAGVAELVGVGPLSRVTVEAAREAGLSEAHHAETFEDTMVVLLKRLAPGDAVLVKGSRGMRMERVMDALVARFGPERPFAEAAPAGGGR